MANVFIPVSLVSGSFLLNLNLILIVFFLSLYFFLSKKSLEYIKLEWFKVAFLFFIYQILSSVVNGGNLDSLVRAFGFIKFITLTMTLLIIFELNHKNFLNFIKILFAVALFIIIDSIFQFSTGQNLFGNQYIAWKINKYFW